METKDIFESLKQWNAEAIVDLCDTTADPYLSVEKDKICLVLTHLRDDPELKFDMLQMISGVDRVDCYEVVYHLTSIAHGHRITLKTKVDHEHPHTDSAAGLYPAANWHERETYDLLGIVFDGHPNLRRILLPEDWEGHPLRKNYEAPESYHGISHRENIDAENVAPE